jgi:hypothetical protein
MLIRSVRSYSFLMEYHFFFTTYMYTLQFYGKIPIISRTTKILFKRDWSPQQYTLQLTHVRTKSPNHLYRNRILCQTCHIIFVYFPQFCLYATCTSPQYLNERTLVHHKIRESSKGKKPYVLVREEFVAPW